MTTLPEVLKDFARAVESLEDRPQPPPVVTCIHRRQRAKCLRCIGAAVFTPSKPE